VLDPFCGCATALVAADRLGRKWAGIDLSLLAIKLVKERIVVDPAANPLWAGTIALDTPPKRTDLGNLPNYRTHRLASTVNRKVFVWAAIPTSPSE